MYSALSGWNSLSQLCQLHSASPKNSATQRANFAPVFVQSCDQPFSSFLFFFLSRFYLIIHAFLPLKIWNYRQRSFSLPFKMLNLHPYKDFYFIHPQIQGSKTVPDSWHRRSTSWMPFFRHFSNMGLMQSVHASSNPKTLCLKHESMLWGVF